MTDEIVWKDLIIADLGKVVTGKTPPTSNSEYFGGDIPFVTPTDMDGRRIISTTERYLTKIGAEAVKGSKLPANSVIVSCIGSQMGKVAITGKPCVTNQQINSIIVSPEYSELFVYYSLSMRGDEIRHIGSGSAVPILNKSDFSNLSLAVPPLPEQQAIAGILGALDDKIELNRHMNRTLESIAWAMFHELIKEERGKETTIGEVVTVVGGSTPSTSNPTFWDDGDIHWASPKDLSTLQDPILLDTNSRITELGLQEISSGLLPVGTVLLSSRAPIGYLAITQIPVAINQGFIAIKCTDEVPNYFILNWLKDNMEEIIGRANGTTFLEISKSNFRPMKIFVPTPKKMESFVEQVEPLYQRIVSNLKESNVLATIRDNLLPKLMKGEVTVKDL